MKRSQFIEWLLLALFLVNTGCIMGDSKIRRQTPVPHPQADFRGSFLKKASYYSEWWDLEEFQNIHEFLTYGVYPIEGLNSFFKIVEETEKSFSIQIISEEEILPTDTLIRNRLVRFERGEIRVKKDAEWFGGDSPGIGFGWSSMRLFLNPGGDLVVVQKTGAAGFATIIPAIIKTKGMAIFPKP